MTNTTTVFRQKICLKCRNNHNNEGTLCQICIDKEKRRKARIKPAPENYLVECMIRREGSTVVGVNGMNYRFEKNELGHSVCNVVNPGHYRMFVEKMHKLYRAYKPEDDYADQLRQIELDRLERERQAQEAEELDQQQKYQADQAKAVQSQWTHAELAKSKLNHENEQQGNWQEPGLPLEIKEPGHDSVGAGNRKAESLTGGDGSGADRTGGGKRGNQRNRSGAGASQVGSVTSAGQSGIQLGSKQ